MSKKLMIVESPTKVKTIQTIVGNGIKVLASAGHIRDLPEKEMGVDPPDYRPRYEITKKDVVNRLRSAAKSADVIYLATDSDREGEAIAWHIKEAIGKHQYIRVSFQEITKAAIEKAIISPGKLNVNMVAAQETRRVLDRLAGYRVSGPLSDLMKQKASAGRVQSVAMRLVVERDIEIENFVPTDHYDVIALMPGPPEWQAKWDFKPYLKLQQGQEGPFFWTDRKSAERVASTVKMLKVNSVEKKRTSRKPPAPFTTSTLVQKASSALGFDTEKTMKLAQSLFEGDGKHGFITYHRTDSPNLSDEAIRDIWGYLKKTDFAGEIPDKPNKWKAKGGAQEAHEAIRPTDINARTVNADPDAQKLYKLIWERAVASQMKAALYDVTSVRLLAMEKISNKTMEFIASGRVLVAPGWQRIGNIQDEDDSGNEKEANQQLPKLTVGEILTPESVNVVDRKTRAPATYTEASLVKDLETRGVGRPSTYASIMRVIKSRGFVEEKKKRLLSTPFGHKVYEAMLGRFDFFEIDFTSKMEENLDLISLGQAKYREAVSSFDACLVQEIEKIKNQPGYTPGAAWEKPSLGSCPVCGKDVVESPKAFGCSGYKEGCKFTLWKNGLDRFKKKITPALIKKLLEGKTTEIKGLTSKGGKKFDAKCAIKEDPKWGWQISLIFNSKQ